jgi:hypothetical protein
MVTAVLAIKSRNPLFSEAIERYLRAGRFLDELRCGLNEGSEFKARSAARINAAR